MNHILRQCIKSFHKFGCDKIIFWNDSNSNVYDNELLRFLVVKKEWAFVSDFFRLKVRVFKIDTKICSKKCLFSVLLCY